MQTRRRHSLILAFALLLGQWLAFAHGLEHPALQADLDCQLCAQVQSLGGALPVATSVAVLPLTAALPVASAQPQAPRATALRAYRSRGPPQAQA